MGGWGREEEEEEICKFWRVPNFCRDPLQNPGQSWRILESRFILNE